MIHLNKIKIVIKSHDTKIINKKYQCKIWISSLLSVNILVKSNVGKKCLINSLMNMSNEALMGYLELANVYNSNSSKKKTDLVEIIVYGLMNG